MQKLNKLFLVALVMLTLGWASPASADVVVFDPDGGGALAPRDIGSLDWLPGNAVAVGATANSGVNTTFQLFYQANLGTALDPNDNPVYLNNTGAGGTQDSFTLVLGFQETITSTNFDPASNTGNFQFAFAAGGANFFQIYANDVTGSNLSGSCFVCGSLVMSGSIIPQGFVSTFSASGGPLLPLDGSANGNQYPGVTSIVGTGSVTLVGQVTSFDTNYFNGVNGALIDFAFANANTNLPYSQIDPSACFFSTTTTGGGIGATTCNGTGGSTGVAPFLGVQQVDPVNGLSGPNTMFQADGNNSFSTAAPEPATLLLLGIGLLGSAATRRRQKK